MNQFTDIAIDSFWTTEQWTYIRKNIGEWQGSFIQFSPEAVWVSETPSLLTLKEDCPGQHMTLVLKRTPQGKPTHTMERDLGYPGAAPYICFFPTGAFSQGAMQRRPWSSFGSEFSLLANNCRMRLVQLYKGTASGEHTLDYVTLIPEHRSPKGPDKDTKCIKNLTSRLSLDTLLGTWQGDRIFIPATMDLPQVGASHWQAQYSESELILSLDSDTELQRFTSVDQQRWQAISHPLQFWLLPGNASCTVYPQLPRQHGAHLELCWYLSSHQRQRIVRDYGPDGSWIGTSLMLETKV
ncbi:MAG: DUF3598 family protein [Cyanobacteria bacterium P01_F01_bin.13]